MAGGDLDIPERDSGVKCGGDEAVPQRMRRDVLGDAGPAGDAAHDAGGAVAVQALPRARQQERPAETFPRSQVESPTYPRGQRDDGDLGALF